MESNILSTDSIQNDRTLAKVRLETMVERMLMRIMNVQDPLIDLSVSGTDDSSDTISTDHDVTAGINFTLLSRNQQGTFVGAKDLASLLRVTQSSHQMLCRDRTITQRELYYLHAHYFKNQNEAIVSLNKLQTLLMIPRHTLGILAASKGWISGLIKINETRIPNNYVSLASGIIRPIPSDVIYNPMSFQSDNADFILVVEKECIFRRLVKDKVWASDSETERTSLPCILVTGCGFPDYATRALLSQLHHQLKLPIYGLSDYNPYGLGIMLCYMQNATSKLASKKNTTGVKRSRIVRRGSSSTVENHTEIVSSLHEPYDINDQEDIDFVDDENDEENYTLTHRNNLSFDEDNWDTSTTTSTTVYPRQSNEPLAIEWIGLRSRDIEKYKLSRSVLQGFTYMDERKTVSLMKDPFLLSLPERDELLEECDTWLTNRYKMEIEGLLSRGLDFLHEYLWDKIYGLDTYTDIDEDYEDE